MPPSERVFTGPHPDQGRCVLPAGVSGPSSGERAGAKAHAPLPGVSLPVMPSRAWKGHLRRIWRDWDYWCPQLPLGHLNLWGPLATLLMPFRDAPTLSPAFSSVEEIIISFPTAK